MGFSSALQSKVAHEALLSRQDAELRLLETMKRCLTQKAKCDKEYATSLAAVAQQGLKIDRLDDLQGSQITKSWRTFMDELEHIAKQIKMNAEQLDNNCLEKLSQLYQEKRKARKQYQEEHSKIATQFSHLTEDVARKKTEYQKHLEYYKLLRTKFEEHYIKSGRSGRKLDDVRDKYQKACRKLHLAHNEYVLVISEAVEVEKDFRTILLPGLLEHQQTLQEGFILAWRNLLQEVAQLGDYTSEKFSDIQKVIASSITNVNPSEEYKEFTEKHKTSPTTPIVFQFDESLIEDSLGKLQANTLTVDNLTVDWLKSKQNDLENSIKDLQEKQNKLCLENGTPSTPILNGNTKEHGNRNSKELNSLRCQERQIQKSIDLIKTALNDVGCEELPSGCDDLSVDTNFIENVNQDQSENHSTITSNSGNLLQKGAGVVSLIRDQFKRKSTIIQSDEKKKPQTPKPAKQSVGSSTNSVPYSEIEHESENFDDNTNKRISNIYVDMETNLLTRDLELATNNSVCPDNNPTNNDQFDPNEDDDGENEMNNSKNNLLQADIDHYEKPLIFARNAIKSSIDAHLDSIDELNFKLDQKLIQKSNDSPEENLYIAPLCEDFKRVENTVEKASFRDKIRKKMKMRSSRNDPIKRYQNKTRTKIDNDNAKLILNERDILSDDTTASKSEVVVKNESKKKRRKKKRKLNVKRNNVSEDELLYDEADESRKNKVTSGNGNQHSSFPNAIFSSFRENIKSLNKIHSVNKMKIIGDFIENKDEKIPDAKYTFSDDIELKDSEDEHENGADYANSEVKAQVTDLDDEDNNSKSSATTSHSTITSKFKENLKFTFSKLNLKIPKLTKSLSSKSPITPEILFCHRCSKQIFPLHLSQRVMNLAQLTDDNDDISAKVIEDIKPENDDERKKENN